MTLRDEIEALRDKDELIHAERLVSWAHEHTDSQLHRRFQWDDSVAAHQWRLNQARQLIRYHLVDEDHKPEVISLRIDRRNGGGYRDRKSAMSDAVQLDQIREDAMAELMTIKEKYDFFREFEAIWKAIDACQKSWKQRKKRRRPGKDAGERPAAS